MPHDVNPPAENLRSLLSKRAQAGRVTWLGVRSERGAPMQALETVELLTGRGLAGDRASMRSGGKRQVSLLQAEHLPVIAALTMRAAVDPDLLRRNVVITGISVLALRACRFRIGSALLEGTGTCDPCSKMERALGVGGYNAMRGHGGVLARVVEGAWISLGDEVDIA